MKSYEITNKYFKENIDLQFKQTQSVFFLVLQGKGLLLVTEIVIIPKTMTSLKPIIRQYILHLLLAVNLQ